MVANRIVKSRDYCRQWEQAWAGRAEHRRVPAAAGAFAPLPVPHQGLGAGASRAAGAGVQPPSGRAHQCRPAWLHSPALLLPAELSPILSTPRLLQPSEATYAEGTGEMQSFLILLALQGVMQCSLLMPLWQVGWRQAGRQDGWMDVRRVLSSCSQVEGSRRKLARAACRAPCKVTLFWVPVL